MHALVYDAKEQPWETTRGFLKRAVADPVINKAQKSDQESVIIKVVYAGVCGTDRGLWNRTNFKDAVLSSLAHERSHERIIGHELCGEIVAVGRAVKKRFSLAVGDFVAAESHVICQQCWQCTHGQTHVCINEKIIGISYNGGFAEYIKLPAHVLWKVDRQHIRPEIVCLMEPFGNAVHVADAAEVKEKHLMIFGAGPIGLFLILIARARGAASITVSEPQASSRHLARQLGATRVVTPKTASAISGVDVAFDMVGHPDVTNSAIASVRRGGQVMLFGLKAGDLTIPHFEKVVRSGLTLQAIIGRRLWQTWESTQELLLDKKLGIQEFLWNVLLKRGRDTILPFQDFTAREFERRMGAHPKFILKIS
jgi:threonine 3-dehydrogenase